MKIFKAYSAVLLFLLICLSYVFMPSFFLSGTDVSIPVYSKSSARDIARTLKEKGVLRFTTPFRFLTKVTGADRHLKAGLYRFNARMSLWQVLSTLSMGKSALLTLKVPEGFTADQIAQELQKMGESGVADFLQASQDAETLKALGITGPTAEGFLFPETYRVPLGADPSELVELMVRQFWDAVGKDFEVRCAKVGMTPYRAVILASIVEKEAHDAEERPVIAGVLYNRLHQKMRLQVNATLNYILNTGHAWLTTKQINETQTPYNTYLHRGLPPTPICNPGLASIRAVLEPAQVPYLYYVSAGDGSHLFATTFEEHTKNVREAKKIRRTQRRQKPATK
jgi:UPF0755 protein